MKSGVLSVGLSVLAALLLGGCGKPGPVPPPRAADETEIAWFAGGVDAAFAASRESGRPVLLYWGAEWCPDCQQLKSSVFSRPDFIARSQLFVPVYLDGDLPGAQQWGDVFRVTGYPTMVILDGDRREITRLAGGMDLNLYAELLDNALGDVRPIEELVELAGRREELSADECRRLAYHAFGLEDAEVFPVAPLVTALDQAATRCPTDAQRLRLLAAVTSARSQPGGPAFLAAVRSLHDIVGERATGLANLDLLMGLDSGFFAAARQADPPLATALAERLVALADVAVTDGRFAPADQLFAERLRVRAAASLASDGRIEERMAAAAIARAEAMLAKKHSAFEHASIVNAAVSLYRELDETARARLLVQAEAASSKRPWYYLGDLAKLEEAQGNHDRAIELLAEAYAKASGPASRFQWGYNYVSGLVRMTPDDLAAIETVGQQVIGELGGPQNVHRRTRLRLEQLGAELRAWSAGQPPRQKVLSSLEATLAGVCGSVPTAGPVAKAPCARLLRGA